MDSVDQFEIGADLAHGLELTAKVHVRSPEDAEKLTSAVALAQTMLKSSQSSLRERKWKCTRRKAGSRSRSRFPRKR